MNQRAAIPRGPNDNSIGNQCEAEQKAVYNRMQEVVRVASRSGFLQTIPET